MFAPARIEANSSGLSSEVSATAMTHPWSVDRSLDATVPYLLFRASVIIWDRGLSPLRFGRGLATLLLEGICRRIF